jgi:hypothetical protein
MPGDSVPRLIALIHKALTSVLLHVGPHYELLRVLLRDQWGESQRLGIPIAVNNQRTQWPAQFQKVVVFSYCWLLFVY